MKKVFKYATGQDIPEGAVYLSTVTQTEGINESGEVQYHCWNVWHYFLVEVKD